MIDEDFNGVRVTIPGCGHQYCEDCLRGQLESHWAAQQINGGEMQPFRCAFRHSDGSDCNRVIPNEWVQQHLPEEDRTEFSEYLSNRLRYSLPILSCPKCKHQFMYRHPEGKEFEKLFLRF